MSSPLRGLARGSMLVGKRGQRHILLDPLLKKPDDEEGAGWADLNKEIDMQKLLYKCSYICRMVNVIPPPCDTELPVIVPEVLEKSLWSARLRRPFSLGEILSVMRSIAIGLSTIHHNNIVYTGLSATNAATTG